MINCGGSNTPWAKGLANLLSYLCGHVVLFLENERIVKKPGIHEDSTNYKIYRCTSPTNRVVCSPEVPVGTLLATTRT